jgi:DNA-binding transcriptional ArsR family regulator
VSFRDEAVKVFKALGDPTRYAIVCKLLDQGELGCGQFAQSFELSTPALSHHYRVLENAGLITARKEATRIYYQVDRERLEVFIPNFKTAHCCKKRTTLKKGVR